MKLNKGMYKGAKNEPKVSAPPDEDLNFDIVEVEHEPEDLEKKTGYIGADAPSDERYTINIDSGTSGNTIEGSDFDEDGNLRRNKKKNGGKLSGCLVVIILVAVVIATFVAFYPKVENEPLDNVDAVEPINDTIADEGGNTPPNSLNGVAPAVDSDTLPLEIPSGQGVSPENDATGTLDYENNYVTFNMKYPETWFITEMTHNSFNEIKLQASDGLLDLSKAKLENPIDIVSLKSPSVDTPVHIEVSAHPKEGYKDDLKVKFQFNDVVTDNQPPITASESWGKNKINIKYYIKQEFNLLYLVVQAEQTVGSNMVVYTYKEPFFDSDVVVAEEEPTDEEKEKTKDGKVVEEEEPKPLTLDEIKEVSKDIATFQSLVETVEFQ